MLAIAAIALANLIDDFLRARWDEVILNALVVVICVGAALFMKPHHTDPRVYWFVALTLTAICLYFVVFTESHGGSLFWLYCLPAMACFFLGVGSGIALSAGTFLLASLMIFGVLPTEYQYSPESSLRFVLSFSLLTVVTSVLEYSRRRYADRLHDASNKLRHEKTQLAKALEDVKVLTGLLPTCASCKCIRDSDGIWHPIEDYISERSEAGFSHSICPSCTKILYPDLELPGMADKLP